MADFVGSVACPWCSLGMPRCPPSPRVQGQGRPPGQATGGQDHDRGQRQLRRHLTDDPQVRYTEGGIARAMFRVAASGQREQEASFFTVVVWRDQAEHAAESLSKGSRVVVVGRLQQRSWTAEDGTARSVVEVVAEELGPRLRWAPRPTPAERASRRRAADEGCRVQDRPGLGRSYQPREIHRVLKGEAGAFHLQPKVVDAYVTALGESTTATLILEDDQQIPFIRPGAHYLVYRIPGMSFSQFRRAFIGLSDE